MTERLELAGQVALVTGGGAGIGRGAAEALARRGADVVLAEIDPERGAEAAAAVSALGRRAVPVACDVLDTDQVRAAVAAADEQFGRLDILVNNAGGVRASRFADQSERSWRRHIDMNLVSVLAATSAAVPLMARGGAGGSIVNVSSIEGSRAAPMFAVYAACKAGVNSLTRTLAVELGELGIRVNGIAPDLTRTPGIEAMGSGEHHDARIRSYIPLGREGRVEDTGELVAFLCSPAASYLTGAVIPIDGGTWASSGWLRTTDGGWSLFGSEPR